jgi:hypothetical protein
MLNCKNKNTIIFKVNLNIKGVLLNYKYKSYNK